jgi:hypothetical protein
VKSFFVFFQKIYLQKNLFGKVAKLKALPLGFGPRLFTWGMGFLHGAQYFDMRLKLSPSSPNF